MRQTTSLAGALVEDDDDEVVLLEPPQAAATVESAIAAPITAADLVTFTARFSFQTLSLGWPCGRYEWPLWGLVQKLTGNFPIR